MATPAQHACLLKKRFFKELLEAIAALQERLDQMTVSLSGDTVGRNGGSHGIDMLGSAEAWFHRAWRTYDEHVRDHGC